MIQRIRHPFCIDIALRILGLVTLGIAALALRIMPQHMPSGEPGLAAFGLATIGFIGASVGATLVLLGGHVHDRIVVSERWRRR